MDAVLNHHIYEYNKGLRRLILHTAAREDVSEIIRRFARYQIACEVIPLGEDRANIFFGDRVCVDIVRCIGKNSLADYTPEEDFILGIMLGYCRGKQCERYYKLKNKGCSTCSVLAG